MQRTKNSVEPSKNAEITSAISRQVVQLATQRYGSSLRAIILTGSLARGEGSFVQDSQDSYVTCALGDAELFLVFNIGSRLPERASLCRLESEIETELVQSGVQVHVGLSPVWPTYFENMPRHIFTYELQAWGRILWGDKQILTLIPKFSAVDIDREDAWRLLNNRMLEVLEISPALADVGRTLPPEMAYRIVKLYLDMATSYLVFRGEYEASYCGRSEKLAGMAATAPFSWFKAFSGRVVHCTNLKLSGSVDSLATLEFWREAIGYAHDLWLWELNQLADRNSRLADTDLVMQWARRQVLRRRIRGWAFVLRRCGWHKSWRYWIRWAHCAMLASPRYCIYAAGSELLFRLPSLLDSKQDESKDFKRLYALLPVARSSEQTSWQALALAIAWNYREFLETTTA